MRSPSPLVRLLLGTLLLLASSSLSFGYSSQRMRDASNLRMIGQASLIYAQSNKDILPRATDVWNYAELLAKDGTIGSADLWQSRMDPAAGEDSNTGSQILFRPTSSSTLTSSANNPSETNPEFRKLKLSVAIPLGSLDTTMPVTTPIAWTRGLQLDGTWAAHSPYGPTGGFIVFLDTSVVHFEDLKKTDSQLTRFDGKGKTANILEALPPGTRISEYIPTDAERTAWSIIGKQVSPYKPPSKPLSPLILGLGWLTSLAIITVLFGRKIIGRATLLFAIALVTFALAVLGASLNTRFSP